MLILSSNPPIYSYTNIFPFSIWLLYFVNAMQSSILYNLIPYVTSDFSSHSLLNVIYIVASAISAAVYIPLAKILDLWGRAEGFLVMTMFATLGLILMAVCHNLPTFCAAHVRTAIKYAIYSANLSNDLGILQHWIWRYDILRRRYYCRFLQTEKSWFGIRLHIFSIHHYCIRWC